MKKKIAFIDAASYSLPYDYHMVKALSKVFDVDVYCSNTHANSQFIDGMRQIPGVKVCNLNISNKKKTYGSIIYILLLIYLTAKKNKYYALSFQYSIGKHIDLLFFFINRNKVVFTIHDPIPHDGSARGISFNNWIGKVAKKIIFPSHATYQQYVCRVKGNLSCEKVSILPHGMMGFTPTSDHMSEPTEKTVLKYDLAFWGRVEKYKGIETLVKLQIERPELRLAVYGKWDISLKPIKEQLNAAGVMIYDEYILPANLHKMLCEVRVFILPYIRASQSGVLYNLANYGKIFVVSNVGDLPEFARAIGHPRLIFERNNMKSLLDAINYAFNRETQIRLDLNKYRSEASWAYSREEIERSHAVSW